MIAITALWLLIAAMFNSFNVSTKADKRFCGLVLLTLFALLFWFVDHMLVANEQVFSVLWNSSPSGDIKIDIISNTYNCLLFLPFFVITILAVCTNFCFRIEEKRCKYNALLLFNLFLLLMMITSNNFVQLLSAMFLVDIFAVVQAKNIIACKKYIIINLVADMIIFMLLALINERVDSLDIREIINYKNMGYHLDFIAILGFTSILIKMGFVPFQIGLAALNELRFPRLLNILYLSSPISALILLLKFSSLWGYSAFFLPYLNYLCIITMLWCFFKSLGTENLKEKIVCWQMMIYALLLELLRFHGFVWNENFSKILLAEYILFNGVFLLYHYSGRKKLMQQFALVKFSKANLAAATGLIFLAVLSLAENLEEMYNNRNRYYIWVYAVLFLLSFCGALHQICFSGKKNVWSSAKNGSGPQHCLFLFLNVSACLFLFWRFNWTSPVLWGISGAFVMLFISGISEPLCKSLQQQNPLYFKNADKVYHAVFVGSIQNVGRLLWLIIDWKLVEKLVTELHTQIWQKSLRFFRLVQNNLFLRFLVEVIVVLGFLLFPIYLKELR